jgi:hypothetical protein
LGVSSNRIGLGAFVAALVLPVVAMMVKPTDYSFYMFHPATPDSDADRFRLLIANGVLIAAAVGGALSALWLCVRGVRRRKWLGVLAPVVIALHPLLQPVFLEEADTYLNYRWRDRVGSLGLVGKPPAEVRALLGGPDAIVREATYTIWEYKPLPWYWLGSKGQLFFVAGRVRSVDANDD